MPTALAHLAGPLGIALVDHVEGELADLRDVAPVGQDARACRQDLVGREVVAHLEDDRERELVRQRVEVR